MTAAYAVKAAGENAAAAAVASDARAWGAALEAALARVAARHGAVLLPARAVAAGAPDMTARSRGGAGGVAGLGPLIRSQANRKPDRP